MARSAGRTRPVIKDVMLASADQVAIDAVAAKLMGFDPLRDCKFIRLAHERGLGCGDVKDIELVGDLDAPRDLATGAVLELTGDLDALVAGVLAEPGRAAVGAGLAMGVGVIVRGGQSSDDGDLLPVGDHLGVAVEPGVGEAPGEPVGGLGYVVLRTVSTHAYTIT